MPIGALPKMLAPGPRIAMLRSARARRAPLPAKESRDVAARRPTRRDGAAITEGTAPVKVIASSLRKGNIVDIDDKLYVIMTAENIHPGKGTPVTQIDMRRLSDGVKSSLRFKTTDQVERAHVEEREYQYLYQDGDGFHFMNMESYDQVAVQEDVIGEQSVYLHPEMKVRLLVYEGVAVGIELPPRVALEVVETEPTTRGQTASSSFKPAVLSNGVRTSVPPHIVPGTRIVVSTVDGSYMERAKD
jgi:elongation factor P